MKICRNPRKPSITAFSFVDLLVVVTILMLAFALLLPLPGMMQSRPRAQRIRCVNNLKNVGLALRIFSTDNQDQFPFEAPVSKGGTMEWRSNAVVLPHFKALSKELSTPEVLYCLADKERKPARDFASLTEQNISYFINISRDESYPQSILAGDRMLMTNGVPLRNQFFELTPGSQLQITPNSHSGGVNMVLGDGSVQQLSLARLREQLTNSVQGTNGPERWVFP